MQLMWFTSNHVNKDIRQSILKKSFVFVFRRIAHVVPIISCVRSINSFSFVIKISVHQIFALKPSSDVVKTSICHFVLVFVPQTAETFIYVVEIIEDIFIKAKTCIEWFQSLIVSEFITFFVSFLSTIFI